jgi:hypothetical protein
MTPRVPLNVNTVKVDHDVIYLTTLSETQSIQRQMKSVDEKYIGKEFGGNCRGLI